MLIDPEESENSQKKSNKSSKKQFTNLLNRLG